jgi:hypothetical protein
MAVIDVRAEPSGRTRMLFDFRAAPRGCDDVARITSAMTQSNDGASDAPPLEAPPPPRASRQAASARSTSRPVTLPSRRRISAS